MGTKSLRVVKLDDPKIQVAKKQGGGIAAGALLNSGKMIAKASDPDIPYNVWNMTKN